MKQKETQRLQCKIITDTDGAFLQLIQCRTLYLFFCAALSLTTIRKKKNTK